MSFSINGKVVDIPNRRIYPATVVVNGNRITSIEPLSSPASPPLHYILPGFIDAHVHIESSMLIPSEFARLAVPHGTVATISDPHEIANVCGLDGVNYMIENGKTVPFKFYFGAPSCVPATTFETAGAAIDAKDINDLMKREDIWYLSEMMNFPGVLNGDKEVLKKIAAAKRYNKPVDGHAPGLMGEAARQYISAGISTDHECYTKEEALDKLKDGMKIIIREGSAAKNFEALIDLLNDYPDSMMFCSDDKHPDSLVEGHINQLCVRAVAKGIDVFKVLQAACINPVKHYQLKVGVLRKNDFADFIVVKDLQHFEVLQNYINGELVAENGKTLIARNEALIKIINNFSCSKKSVSDFKTTNRNNFLGNAGVIEALDGQLITNKIAYPLPVNDDNIISDVKNDILKIAVVNRYKNAPVATAFIKNFGLKKGAIASSVAHDSHNIVAVGVDDESICEAVNLVIEYKGGISCVGSPSPSNSSEGRGLAAAQGPFSGETANNTATSQSEASQPGTPSPSGEDGGEVEEILPLPVAGLMSTEDGYVVAAQYAAMDAAAKSLGATLSAPFMTLSFMALLVIPHLKLSDKGLFDGDTFRLL